MKTMYEKQIRETDPDYKKYLRKQPCIVWLDCIGVGCEGSVVVHHDPSIGAGGSDLEAVSICIKHHEEIHKMGRGSFQKKYKIDLNREKVRLLVGYIKLLKEKATK